VYPFLGQGKWLMIGGAIGMALAQIVGVLLPFVGLFLEALIAGCFAMYAIKNIASSARGDTEPPDWPDFSGLHETLYALLQVLGAAAFSLGPLVAYAIYMWNTGQSRNPLISWPLLAWGMFYMPMAMLGVALHDTLAGVSPLLVLPAIVKTLPAYLVALLAIAGACALFYPMQYLTELPFIGSLLGTVFSVYWITVVTRIVGLIYRAYEKRLNWFPME